jgi:hypothetical protein
MVRRLSRIVVLLAVAVTACNSCGNNGTGSPLGTVSVTADFSVSFPISVALLTDPNQQPFPGKVVYTGTLTSSASGQGQTCINDQMGSGCAQLMDDTMPTATSVCTQCPVNPSSPPPTVVQDVQSSGGVVNGLAPGTWKISATISLNSPPPAGYTLNNPTTLTCQTLTVSPGRVTNLILSYLQTTGCH